MRCWLLGLLAGGGIIPALAVVSLPDTSRCEGTGAGGSGGGTDGPESTSVSFAERSAPPLRPGPPRGFFFSSCSDARTCVTSTTGSGEAPAVSGGSSTSDPLAAAALGRLSGSGGSVGEAVRALSGTVSLDCRQSSSDRFSWRDSLTDCDDASAAALGSPGPVLSVLAAADLSLFFTVLPLASTATGSRDFLGFEISSKLHIIGKRKQSS
jgi:hypothetical protein